MLKAKIGKEIILKVRNETGVLAKLTKLIAERGTNVLAASAWVDGQDGIVHLVTDDNLRAADTLRAKNYPLRESDVVLVEMVHTPGMLRRLTGALADAGIDINHLYASALLGQDRCLVVCGCTDNERAVVVLQS